MLSATINKTDLKRVGAGEYVVVAEVSFVDDVEPSLNHSQVFTAQSSDDGDAQFLKRLIRQYVRRFENLKQLQATTSTGAVGDEPTPTREQQRANQWFEDYMSYRRKWTASTAGLVTPGTPSHDAYLAQRAQLKKDFQPRFLADDRFELVVMDTLNGLSLKDAN